MEIGKKIRGLRKDQGLRQSDLAERSSVSALTIVRIENGQVQPIPATIRVIADALGVGVDELKEVTNG